MDFLLFLYLKPEKETGRIKSPLLDKGTLSEIKTYPR